MLEVGDAPTDLSAKVTIVRESKDGVAVSLSYRRSVTSEVLGREAVGVDDRAVGVRCMPLEPRKCGRAEIEADPLEVVDPLQQEAVAIEESRLRVRLVALRCDSLIPVRVRRGGRALFYRSGERIGARRLIEMAVNANVVLTAQNQSI